MTRSLDNIKGPGHRYIDHRGYVRVIVCGREWQYEHRLVMEEVLGRKLLSTETVHHCDHDKQNNSPDNLEIKTASRHIADHNRERAKKNKGGTSLGTTPQPSRHDWDPMGLVKAYVQSTCE